MSLADALESWLFGVYSRFGKFVNLPMYYFGIIGNPRIKYVKNVSRPYVEHSFSVLGGSYENGMDDRDNCRDSFYSLSIILLYCCRKRVR